MKARLIIDRKCSRNCDYCCNKVLSVEPIKVTLTQFLRYVVPVTKAIMITGGEPFECRKLFDIVKAIRDIYDKPMYLYTQTYNVEDFHPLISYLNGFTYTIHFPLKDNDLEMFEDLQRYLNSQSHSLKDTIKHLTINKDVGDFIPINPAIWDSIKIPKFIQSGECPLPDDEVLYELVEDKDYA